MNSRTAKFCLLIFFLPLVSMIGKGKSSDELPRGMLIEKVVCQKDSAQNYSLYLPSNYSPEKKWAVLYAFDPFAHGKVPVEIFREAAEHFGFILVGSNNSQNNLSSEKLSEIITAFWTDTHTRFNIDDKRAYAVGLSGGARVATYFAASCHGCLTGVIVCGATFTSKPPLDKPLSFSIFGTAGVDDFNYPEMIKTFAELNKNGTTNHLTVFDGRHGWLTKDLAFDALEWMNLQAMKSGRIGMDEKFVEDLFIKQTNKAQTLFQKGDMLEAARAYETIITDFKNVSDTKSAAENLSGIYRQKSYNKLVDEEKKSFDEQQRTAGKIIDMGTGLLNLSVKSAALKMISDELEIWQQRAKASVDSGSRRLARRILDEIFIVSYETALFVNERQKDYEMMIANLELMRLVNPQNNTVLLELARAFLLGNRKKDALNTLEQAVKNGFADCPRIIEKPEWKGLHDDKGFQNIIRQMNCSDKRL